MRSVVEIGASVPAFLGKLWKLVNDSETNHLISWSVNGKTFVIKNQADFARDLLPLYYKHNNMASFIRQLNMYGFHKITSVENGGLRYDKDEIEFSHPCFMRGHAYLLEHIKRKIANPKAVTITSSDNGEKLLFKPEVMSKVLADVKQMKGKQESLDAKFSAMKQENEALWREVAILRQKHIKQQQIVNNLIQFLMSLVQPSRSGNPNPNGVGVKRPYQLMINNAAHNSSNDQTYSQVKNFKLDKDAGLGDDLNDDNLEDGPTIHELAHDDNLQNELSPDHLNSSEFVTVQMNTSPYGNAFTGHSPNDVGSQVYHVTLEDGDELETDHTEESNVASQKVGTKPRKNSLMAQPQVTSPSARVGNSVPRFNEAAKKIVVVPSTSKTKIKVNRPTQNVTSKNLLSPSHFNVITPSTDFKLPAEIFASDDSVSDAGTVVADDTVAQMLENTTTSMPMLAVDPSMVSNSKDKMLGGIDIKVERLNESTPAPQHKKTKSKHKDDQAKLNLQDIKTELQDDLDWNMSLATVNNYNDVNKLQAMNREDYYSKNYDGLPSHLGTNVPKTDIDDHLDTMQTDLESLRELLRSDSYALDANTLLGIERSNCGQQKPLLLRHTQLFGSDDPLYGLAYNPVEERSKNSNSAKKQKGDVSEGRVERAGSRGPATANDADATNQLISYTGNIPDFEDISIPDLDGEDSQDVALSPLLSESTLNTPHVVLKAPNYCDKP